MCDDYNDKEFEKYLEALLELEKARYRIADSRRKLKLTLAFLILLFGFWLYCEIQIIPALMSQ